MRNQQVQNITYKIPDTDLWINVYTNRDWYLTKLLNGKVRALSPVEAGYKTFPAIDTMKKLEQLAEYVVINHPKYVRE